MKFHHTEIFGWFSSSCSSLLEHFHTQQQRGMSMSFVFKANSSFYFLIFLFSFTLGETHETQTSLKINFFYMCSGKLYID